jgi:hypothetical protein
MNSLIHILPTGEILGIKTPAAEAVLTDEFGQRKITRASYIRPCHPVKRIAFRLLRAVFAHHDGRFATAVKEWCRRWRGPWAVSWANQPHRVVFSHPSRRVCIQWEINQLNERLSRESYYIN